MADLKDYISQKDTLGDIHVSEDVVVSIISSSIQDIEGVACLLNAKNANKGVHLENEEDGTVVDLFIMVRPSVSIPDVAAEVQKTVFSSMEASTGFRIKAVNVHVGGIQYN